MKKHFIIKSGDENAYGENTWEYYFEPVAKISYRDVIGNNIPKQKMKIMRKQEGDFYENEI